MKHLKHLYLLGLLCLLTLSAAAVEAVKQLSLSIGIPQKLNEIGVRKEDLHTLAIDAFNDVCTGGNPRPTSIEDIEALYNKAYE